MNKYCHSGTAIKLGGGGGFFPRSTHPSTNYVFSVVLNLKRLAVYHLLQLGDVLASYRRHHDISDNFRESLVIQVFLNNAVLECVCASLSVVLRE